MGRLQLNLDIFERVTPTKIVLTVLGAVLTALPGAGVGLVVDALSGTEDGWWVGALTTGALGTIVLTGIISYETDKVERKPLL